MSVIIPTYNREEYLREAIDSVLRQTFGDLELLVVDDGSTDSTSALTNVIGDPRIHYLAQSHRGLSAALNLGLQNARGEYVARLDSDDVYLKDALATLVRNIETLPAVDVVWACGRLMDREGHDQSRTRGSREHFPGEMLRSLVYDDCTSNSAMLTRRSCFALVGQYDERLAFSEDWDMALRLASYFRFRFVNRVVVRIREHDNTMTGRNSPHRIEFLKSRAAPLDKLFDSPNLPAKIAAMKPIAYANVHIFRGRMLLSTRNFGKALGEFARAIVISRRPLNTAITIVWRILSMDQ